MDQIVYTSEHHAPVEKAEPETLFHNEGGYYSAMLDGIEISRHAGSPFWTDYVNYMRGVYGNDFTYSFVTKEN